MILLLSDGLIGLDKKKMVSWSRRRKVGIQKFLYSYLNYSNEKNKHKTLNLEPPSYFVLVCQRL